jgi:RNA polymerase sigma-70 factor, ECF subfamily
MNLLGKMELFSFNIRIVLLNRAMSSFEFDQLLLSFRKQLLFFALSLTKNRDDAKDLVQDTLLRAITYREKFQDNTNFKAWVYTIMRNTFINEHRRSKRVGNLVSGLEHAQEQIQRVESQHSTESALRMREIATSVNKLDGTFRCPFEMHHDGYKYHEIAERLSIPVGTVKSRIHQARLRLMSSLSERSMAMA